MDLNKKIADNYLFSVPRGRHDKTHYQMHVTTLTFDLLHSLFEVMDGFLRRVICRTKDDFTELEAIPECVADLSDKPHIRIVFLNLIAY